MAEENFFGTKGRKTELALTFLHAYLPLRKKGFTVLEHNAFPYSFQFRPSRKNFISNPSGYFCSMVEKFSFKKVDRDKQDFFSSYTILHLVYLIEKIKYSHY